MGGGLNTFTAEWHCSHQITPHNSNTPSGVSNTPTLMILSIQGNVTTELCPAFVVARQDRNAVTPLSAALGYGALTFALGLLLLSLLLLLCAGICWCC
jgi:hypothetical protein